MLSGIEMDDAEHKEPQQHPVVIVPSAPASPAPEIPPPKMRTEHRPRRGKMDRWKRFESPVRGTWIVFWSEGRDVCHFVSSIT